MPVRSERLFDRARLGTMELELLKICLDFANTADWHTSDQPRETLKDYFGLVSWAVRTGILDDDTAAELSDKAARQPEGAQRTYRRAIDLREAIFRVFSSVARDDRPEESDLSALNAALPEAMAHLRLVRNEGRFEWDWIEDAASFDRVLWARCPVSGFASHIRNAPKSRNVREQRLRMALHRHEPEQEPEMVRHERLRQPGQGQTVLPQKEGRGENEAIKRVDIRKNVFRRTDLFCYTLEAIAKRHERRKDKAKCDEKAEHMFYIRAF